MLSLSRVKELLRYDEVSGVFTWRVKMNNFVKCGDIAGCHESNGYLQIRIDRKSYMAHVLAWFYVTGLWPDAQVDHKNRVRDDNAFCNLRLATTVQNSHNRSLSTKNKSGVKNVSWDEKRSKWCVKITANGKTFKKRFTSFDEAVSVASTMRKELHLDFALV